MKHTRFYTWLLFLTLFTLAACQPQTVEVTRVVSRTETVTDSVAVPIVDQAMSEDGLVEPTLLPMATATSGANENAPAADPRGKQAAPAPRMIIKTGQLDLIVDETETAVDLVTDTILSAGGYIVSQRVWKSGDYTYATMSVGVPVDEFERLMQALGRLGEVTNEVASGQDVTDEYVDLDSRLGNLLATQERLRAFLSEATNVEEILAVNRELSRVEEELEVIQGRMTYLADRAAFSTITLNLNPFIPMPTPTPIPPAASWNPGATAQLAAVSLQESAQEAADFTIYSAIACGPWLLFFGFGAYMALHLWRRFRHNSRPQSAVAMAKEEGN